MDRCEGRVAGPKVKKHVSPGQSVSAAPGSMHWRKLAERRGQPRSSIEARTEPRHDPASINRRFGSGLYLGRGTGESLCSQAVIRPMGQAHRGEQSR